MNSSQFLKLALAVTILLMEAPAVYSQQVEKTHSNALNVDVNIVLVNATVADSEGQYVTRLAREHFRLWEDKVEQKIEYFTAEDIPASIGIVFDVSGSMDGKVPIARDAAVKFLEMGNQDDEYFLIEFSDRPVISADFTSNSTKVQNRLSVSSPKGNTALFDAIYLAVQKVRMGHNPRKALLLITDGEDNWSSFRYSEVKELIKESDVQIYTLGVIGARKSHALFHEPDEPDVGRFLLKELSDLSGGRAFFTNSIVDLDDICGRIAIVLKSQYLLGYVSTNTNKDGKWRKINLKLERPDGLSRLHVRAKKGYYASAVFAQ